MKFTAILLLIFSCQVFAKGYTQKVTISARNVPVTRIFKEIFRQTGVSIIYNEKLFDRLERVSISVRDAPVEEVLKQCLRDQPLEYKIENNTISITKKAVALYVAPVPSPPVPEAGIGIHGKVVNEKGDPVTGVTVMVKGTHKGTSTNDQGEFVLTNVDESAVLTFYAVNIEPYEMRVNGKGSLIIPVKSRINVLDDVQMIAYGKTSKRFNTGAVTSVKPEKAIIGSVLRVDQMLQGQAAGVQVTSTTGAPGAPATIRIRGNNSITAGSEPLFVVDGIIGGGDLNTLNPDDIASMDILKDAYSTSVYGSRGSNGVVLITTKRGKAGNPMVNLNLQGGEQKLPREISMLSGTEYAKLFNESQALQNLPAVFPNPDSYGKGTDWQKKITRTAPIISGNLSMSGGSSSMRYYISGNYFDQEGIILNSGIKRYQFRMNLDGNVSDRFSVGGSVNLGHTNTRNNTVSLTGLAGSALSTPPVIPVYNPDGTYAYRNPDPNAVADFNNPVAMAVLPTNNTNAGQVLGNFFGEYKLLKNLSFKSSIGVDASSNKIGTYLPGSLAYQKWLKAGGEASINQTQSLNWQNENTLNFSTKFRDDDAFEAVAGFTYQAGSTELMGESAKKFATDATTYNNMSLGDPLTRMTTSDYSSWNIVSFLARANYRLKNRYLFSAAGRYDGSSRLGTNNKFAFFPSGAFAWILSEEPFIQQMHLFSFLKFRTSYGISGNQAVGIYQTLSTLATTPYVSDNNSTVALVPSRIENPSLKWETLHQFDLGLESGFFNNRLRVEVDYYNSRTKDLLLDVEIPYQTGYGTMLRNVGEVANEGIELTVNTTNIRGKDFQWETSFNLASNRNKVVSLGGKNDIITHTYNYGLQPAGILRVGQPIGSFYGAITEGLWQSQDEITRVGTMPTAQPGTRRYKDLSGNGVFTNVQDYTILGNGNPKLFGGIQNSFKYRNFGLNFFIEGTYGNKIFNGWTAFNGSSDPTTNQFSDAVNRWTPTHTNTDIPRAGGDRLGEERTPSDKWIYDGTHLRLKTVSLLYTIPARPGRKGIIRSATISLTAVNVLLLSSYTKGYDPEVNTFGTSSTLRGYDYGAYPNNRSLTMGVSVNF